MRILHVTRSGTTIPKYGLPKSLMPLIAGLKEKGHSVTLIDQGILEKIQLKTWESWLINQFLKYIKYRFGEGGKPAWHVLRERVEIGIRAAKTANRQRITHVHCHDALMGYTYNFFRKFYHSTPNWGITEHAFGRFVKLRTGIETSAKSLKVLQKMERKATNAARWIIFPTKSGMDQLLKDMRIAKASHKWHVVPHVVEIEKFDKAIARKQLGISMDDKILVAIGSLIPMKRFDLLFKAIAQIPLVTLQKIIILGDGTEKAALIHLAKELNIQQRINITTTENVGEYLSAADIYVSTSSTESFGIANCEAILAGVPSVVTAVDAVPEVVGDAAILVGDSPMDIAIAIKKVLESEELQTDLKSKSEKQVRGWYKRDKLSDIMIDIYQNS